MDSAPAARRQVVDAARSVECSQCISLSRRQLALAHRSAAGPSTSFAWRPGEAGDDAPSSVSPPLREATLKAQRRTPGACASQVLNEQPRRNAENAAAQHLTWTVRSATPGTRRANTEPVVLDGRRDFTRCWTKAAQRRSDRLELWRSRAPAPRAAAEAGGASEVLYSSSRAPVVLELWADGGLT